MRYPCEKTSKKDELDRNPTRRIVLVQTHHTFLITGDDGQFIASKEKVDARYATAMYIFCKDGEFVRVLLREKITIEYLYFRKILITYLECHK